MASLNDIETKIQSIIDKLSTKTITGTLPLTFTAKEGAADTWTIYGNDELGENLYNPNAKDVNNGYVEPGRLRPDGTISTTVSGICVTEFIPVSPNIVYTLCDVVQTTSYGLCFYDIQKKYISGLAYSVEDHGNLSFTTPNTTAFLRLTVKFDYDTMLVKGSTEPDHFIPYQKGVGEQRQDGYYVPLTISQTDQTDKNYDIYIGDTPLTEGQQVSKTSTGVDLELFEGENTISTTLYNKPTMKINYKWR